MKGFDFEDYDGDAAKFAIAHNSAYGWSIYLYTTEANEKARVTTFRGVKYACPQEVAVALPAKEAARLRDWLTAALAEIAAKEQQR